MAGEDLIQLNEDFLRLFAANQRRIYRYIVTLLVNPDDAEEVLQRTNVALWRKFSEFRQSADFGRWACGFAHFETQHFLREHSRDRLHFDSDLVEQLAADPAHYNDLLETRRLALAKCLKRLSHTDRDLIGLCYGGQASFKDVAQRLNRPLNTVYKALSRIRRSLAECVARCIATEGRQ